MNVRSGVTLEANSHSLCPRGPVQGWPRLDQVVRQRPRGIGASTTPAPHPTFSALNPGSWPWQLSWPVL